MTCATCDIKDFCQEIGRCLAEGITRKFGEVTGDTELEELTADDQDLTFRITTVKDIYKKPLSDQERNFLKLMLK